MVVPGVRRLVAPNPGPMTGDGTNSYLIGERDAIVVDPGPADESHVAAIVDALPADGRIAAVLVTHGHPDHIGGVAMLLEQTKGTVYGHSSLTCVDRPLVDGESVRVGDVAIQALATPGHADDHLCFWVPARRLLFSGDLVLGSGTVVLSESPGALERYLASLERLTALGELTLLPGHGPPVSDGAGKVAEYIGHRRERERQIVEELEAGVETVDELVRRLYAATPAPLRAMAARNVRAHLELLADRDRAESRDGRWRLGSRKT